jgi:hypothetical protein
MALTSKRKELREVKKREKKKKKQNTIPPFNPAQALLSIPQTPI